MKTKERPILFNADMVRAILDGSKTQTRRPVKPQPPNVRGITPDWMDCGVEPRAQRFGIVGEYDEWVCPLGGPGDRLWVRETWGWYSRHRDGQLLEGGLHYRADLTHRIFTEFDDQDAVWNAFVVDERKHNKWRPSIHMPRWASRITLEVTNVRVERVQHISRQDVLAEGVELDAIRHQEKWFHYGDAPGLAFSVLWDSIYDKQQLGWDANPWVWVCEFRRLED